MGAESAPVDPLEGPSDDSLDDPPDDSLDDLPGESYGSAEQVPELDGEAGRLDDRS